MLCSMFTFLRSWQIVFFDDHQGAASIPLHNVDTMATIFPGWGMQCGGIAQYLSKRAHRTRPWFSMITDSLLRSLDRFLR